MRALALFAVAAAIACVASCAGTRADEGRDAQMQIAGAQFFRGAPPDAQSGPNVASIALVSTLVRVGQTGKPLGGALDPAGAAAALTLDGDVGYWVVAAGVPDVQSPTFPSFKASASFARDLPAGTRNLVVRAVDGAGNFGPPKLQPLDVVNPDSPDGALVIALAWDTESDLDLHVVDPTGAEVYKGNINSWNPPPPGQPVDPNAWKTGGILDFDSNAECAIDGRRRENVVYKSAPPAGHYVVRVDTFSLCDEASAHWTVEVRAAGSVVARAAGASFDSDTRMPHDRGAGVLALEFDQP